MDKADIIASLGGSGQIASDLGLKNTTVSNWRHRGIPWRFRNAIADRAKEMGVELPEDFLAPEAA